jgi:hypothetical protein
MCKSRLDFCFGNCWLFVAGDFGLFFYPALSAAAVGFITMLLAPMFLVR